MAVALQTIKIAPDVFAAVRRAELEASLRTDIRISHSAAIAAAFAVAVRHPDEFDAALRETS